MTCIKYFRVGSRQLAGALLLAASMLTAPPADAGFMVRYEGYSVFGLDDQGNGPPDGLTCPLCDSTVSFAVWENQGGNWINDLGLTPTDLVGGSTGQEGYVYLYQVVNTNPLGDPNQNLENFNISFGPPLTTVPYQSGGFFTDTVFQNAHAGESPLDTPNDGSPSSLTTVTPSASDASAFEPDSLVFNTIASAGVAGGAGFEGAQFIWNSNNLIPADGTSSLVFLTSDLGPVYKWAETESPGGFGASGDVPSVPEPGIAALLGLGLVGLHISGRRRV